MMRKEPVLGQAGSFAGGDDQNFEDSDVDQGYRANSGKCKPWKSIAWYASIARPFGQAAKLNDSFPSSAACAVHTAYTPPP